MQFTKENYKIFQNHNYENIKNLLLGSKKFKLLKINGKTIQSPLNLQDENLQKYILKKDDNYLEFDDQGIIIAQTLSIFGGLLDNPFNFDDINYNQDNLLDYIKDEIYIINNYAPLNAKQLSYNIASSFSNGNFIMETGCAIKTLQNYFQNPNEEIILTDNTGSYIAKHTVDSIKEMFSDHLLLQKLSAINIISLITKSGPKDQKQKALEIYREIIDEKYNLILVV